MADLQRTVAVIFEGRDEASAEVAKVEKALQGVETAAGGECHRGEAPLRRDGSGAVAESA